LDVNQFKEKKNGFSYLTWTHAWSEFKKVYPDATYKVWKDDSGRPYTSDPDLGYMCFVSVSNGKEEHEMWLPVMDAANKAMKNKPYEYTVRSGKKRVEAATMFDVNKTIMRCFVKCLAMFGLGLYIYSGEDLPPEDEEQKQKEEELRFAAEAKKRIDAQNSIMDTLEKTLTAEESAEFCKLLSDASKGDASFMQRPIKWLQGVLKKIEGMTGEEIKSKFEEMKNEQL
jgi:hypothetical protein